MRVKRLTWEHRVKDVELVPSRVFLTASAPKGSARQRGRLESLGPGSKSRPQLANVFAQRDHMKIITRSARNANTFQEMPVVQLPGQRGHEAAIERRSSGRQARQ